MNDKPQEPISEQNVNDGSLLILETEELAQLAKFLDALMEADFDNRINLGEVND